MKIHKRILPTLPFSALHSRLLSGTGGIRAAQSGKNKRNRYKKKLALALLLFASGATWLASPVPSVAMDYSLGTLTVSTFARSATYNGHSVNVVPSDTIKLSGGTLKINGDGSEYTALLGTGAGHKAGFSWGTGGTISTASSVTLDIDVLATGMQSFTQTGTIDLTHSGSQKLRLTQNSGTLNISGDLVSAGNVTVSGTTNIAKECSVNDASCSENWLKVDGTLNVGYGLQSNVSRVSVLDGGSITATTSHHHSGRLLVASGGEYTITGAATFSEGTCIVNDGTIDIGDNSTVKSSNVTNGAGALFRVGRCAEFSNSCDNAVFCNTGTFVAEDGAVFDIVCNAGDFTTGGDVTVHNDLDCYSCTDPCHVLHVGNMTIGGAACFEETVDVSDGASIEVAGTSRLGGDLTVTNRSSFVSGGSLISTSDITVANSTLSSGGNITTCGALTVTGDSTLGLSNRLQGSSLGNLTALSGIDLASTTEIVTDLSGLRTVRTPTLIVHMVAGDSTDDFKIDGNTTDVSAVAGLFGPGTVLRPVYAADNGAGYDIYAYTRSLEDYAGEEGLDDPAVDVGRALDDLVAGTDPTDPAYGMAENLFEETDKDVVTRTLYNMAGGYGVENVFSMTLINLGQAGSPFFFGRAAGLPQQKACCQCAECGKIDGPVGSTEYWGAPIYQTFESNGNSYQHGFNVHEAGFVVGARKRYTESTTGGILFAYGAPRLNQSGSLAGYDANYHSRLDMDDYQYALHFEHQTANDFRFSLFVGGGSQTLDVDRRAWGTSSNEIVLDRTLSGSTKGNSLSVTAYLSRPFCLTERLTLSPVIGIDSMHAWLYGFGESSSGTGDWRDMSNLSEGHFYSPVSYRKADYNRNMARVGLWLDYCGVKGGLSGQAFYGTQMGGESFGTVPVATLGGSYNGLVHGYDVGRDSLNLGGGLWRFLDAKQTITVSANYNYFTLRDANASNVNAAIAWRR